MVPIAGSPKIQEGSALSYTSVPLGALEMQTSNTCCSAPMTGGETFPESQKHARCSQKYIYFFFFKKKVTATLGIFHWLKTNKKKLIFFSCALLLPLQHSSVFPQNILTHEKFVIETQQNIHPPMPITTLMCIITTCGFRDRTSVNNACYWVI